MREAPDMRPLSTIIGSHPWSRVLRPRPSSPANGWVGLAARAALIAGPSPRLIRFRFRLQFRRAGVIDVVTAGITAEREHIMTSNAEEPETAQAGPSEAPKPGKKAHVGKRARHVAPSKGKSAKKATPAKKTPTGP